MKRSVKYGSAFVPQRSPDTEVLNSKLDTTGEVLFSDSTVSTGIKLTPDEVCSQLYVFRTYPEAGSALPNIATNAYLVIADVQQVRQKNADGTAPVVAVPTISTLVIKNRHYFNPITNTLWFGEDVGKPTIICDVGPTVASLETVVAGTDTKQVVSAATAKAAWAQWRTQ